MKKLRIRTGDPIYRSQKTWITLVTKGKLVAEPLELDMTVIVKANFLKRIGLAALIALSLAAAQTISLVTRADLSSMGKLASVLAIFLATLVATVTIVWGIRRRV